MINWQDIEMHLYMYGCKTEVSRLFQDEPYDQFEFLADQILAEVLRLDE